MPLKNEKKKIAIVGPFAEKLSCFFGGYAFPAMMGSFAEMFVDPSVSSSMEGFQDLIRKMIDVDSLLEMMYKDHTKSFAENFDDYLHETLGTMSLTAAMKEALPDVEFVSCGRSLNTKDYKSVIAEAKDVCKDADMVIYAVGEITGSGGKDSTSGEGVNNPDLRLPFHQEDLIKEISQLNIPTIMTLFNGRAMALGEVEPLVDAIVECWYPDPSGGKVVANVLRGAYNPQGRLPITFPQISSQCPIYYGTKTGSGYTKIDQTPDNSVMQPLYPFGYGLSYTEFALSNLKNDESVETLGSFKVSFDVTNAGKVKGKDVVQVYTHSLAPTINRPIKELRGFAVVELEPDETKHVEFTFDTRQFGYFNAKDEFVIEPRPQAVYVGHNSSDIALQSKIEFTGEVQEILHDRVFDFKVEVI